MKLKNDQDLKIGLFVTFGLAMSMIAILVLGGSENAFTSKSVYKSHVPNAAGLLNGAKVVLSGLNVGNVRAIEYDPDTRSIQLEFAIEKKYAPQIKNGTTVEILTQGMLGDKYLALSPGAGDGLIAENAEVPFIASTDITQMISKSDQLLVNAASATASLDRMLRTLEKGNRIDIITEQLAQTSKNLNRVSGELDGKDLKKSLRELSLILEKINNGTGTIGALVNDSSLYEDARALVGGANRNRIIRNLVRKTAKDTEKKD